MSPPQALSPPARADPRRSRAPLRPALLCAQRRRVRRRPAPAPRALARAVRRAKLRASGARKGSEGGAAGVGAQAVECVGRPSRLVPVAPARRGGVGARQRAVPAPRAVGRCARRGVLAVRVAVALVRQAEAPRVTRCPEGGHHAAAGHVAPPRVEVHLPARAVQLAELRAPLLRRLGQRWRRRVARRSAGGGSDRDLVAVRADVAVQSAAIAPGPGPERPRKPLTGRSCSGPEGRARRRRFLRDGDALVSAEMRASVYRILALMLDAEEPVRAEGLEERPIAEAAGGPADLKFTARLTCQGVVTV